MSIYHIVRCPYCEHEHDMDEYEFENDNEMDIECESCEKEFEVIREWSPSYSSHSIKYTNCECCNKSIRIGHEVYILHKRSLCQTCHANEYFKWLKSREDE